MCSTLNEKRKGFTNLFNNELVAYAKTGASIFAIKLEKGAEKL